MRWGAEKEGKLSVARKVPVVLRWKRSEKGDSSVALEQVVKPKSFL